ncbi:DUF2384 domain-containing protein [Halomonas cerina]|uniref:Antitoxin Xre/MbcA/ParS-like toxin-binding domain-containing protein n=1 Tax=Halomonas cerina TaxID=447424 RepID=A0A839VBR7_9GAMM|nr:DUF2384 domain-containing protein [Halomonas cerina]MBB3192571.1 hypothetical protein [Halomonas cerina]
MSADAAIDPDEYQAPETYERFVEDLRRSATAAGKPIIDPRLFARALGMDLQALAADAHVHRVTVSRAQGSEKLQGFLREALQVLSAAAVINGDFRHALFWFRNEPISAFDYQTPERLVSEGRTQDLMRYIQALRAGAVG